MGAVILDGMGECGCCGKILKECELGFGEMGVCGGCGCGSGDGRFMEGRVKVWRDLDG